MSLKDKHYTIKVIDGVQYLFYKGEKLPDQTISVVTQDTGKAHLKLADITITVKALLEDTK